jgi:hypothetical protein
MDLKGLDLFLFPLNEPTSCLMSLAAHPSITEIPQVQPQHHYLVSRRSWKKIKNIACGCDFLHIIVSSCSKFPKAPTILQVFSSQNRPPYTFALKPQTIKVPLQQPLLKS